MGCNAIGEEPRVSLRKLDISACQNALTAATGTANLFIYLQRSYLARHLLDKYSTTSGDQQAKQRIHLASIAGQKKNHEYRKYRLRDEVVRLWLYETSDGGRGRAAITFVPPPLSSSYC